MGDVISGNYSDFKLVKTRSVIQIIIELPIERAHEAITLLGMPIPGAEIPVAVARLRSGGAPIEQEPSAKRGTLAQQAGILSNSPAFWKWTQVKGEPEAAEFIRHECGITSRRELDDNEHAAKIFRDLRGHFDLWMKDIAA